VYDDGDKNNNGDGDDDDNNDIDYDMKDTSFLRVRYIHPETKVPYNRFQSISHLSVTSNTEM
jgi:hypothetical protein